MSKQANPRLIGAFVFGGLLLAFGILAVISSMRLFDDRQIFVMYFESSVNNLNVGAPVKWKGVPVGQVRDIRIRWNQDELSAEVPVFVEIDLNRLGVELDRPEVLRREILNGMRAQLQIESLISGLLFIELNYVPSPGAPRFVQREPIYGELPTVPSPLAEIGEMATNIVAKIQSIDLDRIATELTTTLERTNRLLADVDAAGMSRSIKSAANSVTALAGSPETLAAVENAAAAAAQFRDLAARMNEKVDPLGDEAIATLRQARHTLESLETASRNIGTLLAPDSEVVYNLEDALTELAQAARAARDLIEYLERNPRAILTGRSGPPQ